MKLAPVRLQAGIGMVEVLVSLMILMIGLLGLAGLHVKASQSELESYQRSQALVLLQDMTARILANGKWGDCYGITAASNGQPYLGQGGSMPALAAGCPSTVDADLTQWDSLLNGSAEALSGGQVGAMVGARGCIVTVNSASRIYTVSVAWQGLSPTFAPAAGDNCAKDSYGGSANEPLRRVVSTTVRIPRLYP
jgi:type IV pilus assembly protein PilV